MTVGLRPAIIVELQIYCYQGRLEKKKMATRYRFGDSEFAHFITFAVINWIDALSRPL